MEPLRDDSDAVILPDDVEEIGRVVLDVAFAVHRTFGPGISEEVYKRAMAHGLRRRGLDVLQEIRVDVEFEGERISAPLRADLFVARKVVVELKSVETVLPVHIKQTVTYLRVLNAPLGFLLNFQVPLMRQGIRRFVHSPKLT